MLARILDRYRLLTPFERRAWIGVSLIGLLAVGVETLTGGVVYGLVAYLTNPENAASRSLLAPVVNRLPGRTTLERSIAFLLLVGVLHLARTGVQLALAQIHLRLATRAGYLLSCRVLALYLRAPYAFHLARHSAELTNHISNTTNHVFWVLNGAVNLMTQMLTIVGLLGVVLYVSPWPTLLTSAAVAIVLVLFLRLTRRFQSEAALRQTALAISTTRHVQHAFGTFKELRVAGREDFFVRAYERDKMASLALALRQHTLGSLPRILIEAVFGAGVLLAVATGAAQGHPHLAPLLSLFAYVGIRAIPAALACANEINAVRMYLALTEPLLEDLRSLGAGAAAGNGAALPFRHSLVLEGVSFTYEGAREPALRDAQLTIRQGEMLGVVGASGAGKTTLADLILGLHRPSSGRVLVDGVELSGSLGPRVRASYVPQAVYLFDDTLRRNIALGVRDDAIDDGRVRAALRLAQLDRLVGRLELGLDTPLREHGTRLSGGERQRVAIARALYDEPDLLVLDEATSSLDPATERELLATLDTLRRKRTLVVISQRLSTVARCERVVVVKEGRIAAVGGFDELSRASAEFRAWAGLDEAEDRVADAAR